jgi:1-acyl-sn-glycerol-3-phosphate acyltransferase
VVPAAQLVSPAVPAQLAWELLYDAIALGMRLYTQSAFRVVVIAPERLRMEPGLLVVATHRSDADVPVICGRLFFGLDRMYLRHRLRLHFSARDDLFVHGVIAGLLPADTPLPIRRLLFPVNPGAVLSSIRVTPIRSAVAMKAVQALRDDLDAPIESTLPAPLAQHFREAAAAYGLTPRVGRDLDRAEFSDLLWRNVGADELPAAGALWQHRAAEAAGDLRRLVQVVRAGKPLLLFPEGQPSPDGAVGPLQRGVGLLVRRGMPRMLLPLAAAYDHLTLGRPRVLLSVGERFPPPQGDVEEEVLERLRRTMPLTCGQVVAAELTRFAEAGERTTTPAALDEVLSAALEEAGVDGRPIDPVLATPGDRRRRLTDCLGALVRAQALQRRDARTLVLDHSRLLANEHVMRAATEYESIRGRLAVR